MPMSTKQKLASTRNWQLGRVRMLMSHMNHMVYHVQELTTEETSRLHSALVNINAILDNYSESNIKLGLKK